MNASAVADSPPTSPFAADRDALKIVDAMRRRDPVADPLACIGDVHPGRIPRHIAIIMDGNGRWAEARGFPRVFGHRNGAAAVRTVINECRRLGVEVLTLYSFSLENWKRPADEIGSLMQLYEMYLDGEREALVKANVKFRQIGRREGLPAEVLGAVDRLTEATAANTGPTLCVAVNYGARAEIADAARAIAEKVRRGELAAESVDESTVSGHLYTAGLPDPDLLIRTAGEMRVSNYLLWQISYAELHVTQTLWPDFGVAELHAAIRDFASRRRRFGGLDQTAGGHTGGA
ncbi:MAG: isoprenyl transferase [Phycisphaeraceae bacterium]|nr:isoprenyl transferase [Phycisphaeraceae bacterium]